MLNSQLFRFLIVGGTSALLDMVLVILLKEKMGLTPVHAVAVSQIVVVVYNFSLNKFWSFESRALSIWQVVRFLVLLAANYFIAIALMHLFNGILGFDYRLVRLGSIALQACYNFFVYKYWVYR